ncbi:MAG: hypothetical protein K5657_00475 [Desulfovibrio sp.]|nr:hypothetical protein [Desulfovibrio sp.]
MIFSFFKKTFFLTSFVLFASSAVYAAPANHDALMADEEYKNAFESYTATLKEAEERLEAKDFADLKKSLEAAMTEQVKEDMASDTKESEAWESAYTIALERAKQEIKRDWLRRHPEGAQGFYRMQSKAFDGWLLVEKGDEPDLYAVEIYAIQKNAPNNSGELAGFGKLKGNVMSAVDKNDDQNPVNITFKGDTATIAEPEAFKKSGALGAGVTFDGDFVREKK